MTSSGDGFSPEVERSLKLSQDGSSHLDESPVLSFSYTIVLRGICSGILMTNSLFTKKLIQGVVLELLAIVTSNGQYWKVVLVLNFCGEVNDCLLGFTLMLEEVDPCIS